MLSLSTDGFYPSNAPRQLIFHWRRNPSVSWDWWIDPTSSAFLVLEEFKNIDILRIYQRNLFDDWDISWPLSFPAWSDEVCLNYDDPDDPTQQTLYDRAQERANRRLKKKASKAARAQGLKSRHPMPGAWPV